MAPATPMTARYALVWHPDACMGGWVDGWMDGWMDEWMDAWMDGWMDGCLVVPAHSRY